MKKIVIKLTVIMSILFILNSVSLSASAETTDTKDATAQFELVAPKDTLEITNATNLIFENAVISAADVVTTNSSTAIVTVQELSGEATGWKLTAKLSNFIGTTNKKSLNGAQVFYPAAILTTTNGGDSSSILPTPILTDNAFQGTEKGKIIVAGSDATSIVTAEKGKGYGSWTMTYPKSAVQLKVPAGNLKDTYTATLTYTLVDSPK